MSCLGLFCPYPPIVGDKHRQTQPWASDPSFPPLSPLAPVLNIQRSGGQEGSPVTQGLASNFQGTSDKRGQLPSDLPLPDQGPGDGFSGKELRQGNLDRFFLQWEMLGGGRGDGTGNNKEKRRSDKRQKDQSKLGGRNIEKGRSERKESEEGRGVGKEQKGGESTGRSKGTQTGRKERRKGEGVRKRERKQKEKN